MVTSSVIDGATPVFQLAPLYQSLSTEPNHSNCEKLKKELVKKKNTSSNLFIGVNYFFKNL
jgi:hypothetical protein